MVARVIKRKDSIPDSSVDKAKDVYFSDDEAKRFLREPHIIDVNKRTSSNDNPRMTK